MLLLYHAYVTVPDVVPHGADADDTIRNSVWALSRGRGISVDQMAEGIGMPRTTLYRKLTARGRKTAFAAGEVADLARYFRVPVAELFSGLGGLFTPEQLFQVETAEPVSHHRTPPLSPVGAEESRTTRRYADTAPLPVPRELAA